MVGADKIFEFDSEVIDHKREGYTVSNMSEEAFRSGLQVAVFGQQAANQDILGNFPSMR